MFRGWLPIVALCCIYHVAYAEESLCIASSATVSDKSYVSYPTAIYAPTVQDNTAACFSVEKNDPHTNYQCALQSSASVCPIKKEFIDIAVASQTAWIKQPVLCNLRRALKSQTAAATSSDDINIITFGGSVTAGVSTQGCCSKDVCTAEKYYCINNYCNWVYFLGKWMSTFGEHVRTYNLAHAGYNSDTFKDKIVEKLDMVRDNFLFQKSDLVLLDISVNDANTFEGSPEKMLVLERGLEALIRRIHWLSKPDSIPTIILLEMWPGPLVGADRHFPNDTRYTTLYEKIAVHYNISLWSYRDLVKEQFNNKRDMPITEYLTFENNYRESHGHPPWHVHMFYADLLSAIIQRQFDECDALGDAAAAADPYPYPVIKSTAQLPKPLQEHKVQHCDPASAPLISLTAPHIAAARAKTGGVFESILGRHSEDLMLEPGVPVYESHPPDAWKLTEDKTGRPGFIHEFNGTARGSVSRLILRLNATHEELLRPPTRMLQLLFLRTYKNAGMVDLLVCGNSITDGRNEKVELDALWADFETFKFSLPEVYTIELNADRYCTPQLRKDEGKYATIELVHYSRSAHFTNQQRAARDNEKFKLVEVKACKMHTEKTVRR